LRPVVATDDDHDDDDADLCWSNQVKDGVLIARPPHVDIRGKNAL